MPARPPTPAEPLRLPRALREFLREEAAGGGALLVAAALALAWANSPWRASYENFWATRLTVAFGRFGLDLDLRHWVNQGAMAVFFLVVGLEIKRELAAGALREWRQAALPVVAAAGGMVVPALIYAAVNAGRPGAAGWGIPMATDIAFALGVLALLGPRVPAGLKVFLLALAVVDDVGSIVVVAVFYAGEVRPGALLVAAALVLLVVAMRRLRIWWLPPYVAVGLGLWLALVAAGVNAALAGAVMGLLAPAGPLLPPGSVGGVGAELDTDPGPARLREVMWQARGTVSLAERLQHDLHPLSAFLVVPVFALANAGVRLDAAGLTGGGATAVLLGVLGGRVAGKPVGILAAAWLAIRLGVATLPAGGGWRHLAGAATVAGVGLTVPLFVADLAFGPRAFQAPVRLGLLAATLLAGGAGWLLLRTARSTRT
ncbi:MAG TPA: Na+/H+ antiporter NhaA [Actinomycetes bacterium]|jgi:Na+/H+ antiporter NhaA|nr:Na+/H+ antiporter NhaA [Actinomycetes bacterium]